MSQTHAFKCDKCGKKELGDDYSLPRRWASVRFEEAGVTVELDLCGECKLQLPDWVRHRPKPEE